MPIAAGRSLEIELEIFAQLRDALVKSGEPIIAIADGLAVLDVSGSHAILAGEQNYCRPVISDDLVFNLQQARHPVIEQVLAKEGENPFISNSCNIGPAQGQDKDANWGAIWLLTGPNMGGKSTFLRQNALIVLMGANGCICARERGAYWYCGSPFQPGRCI